MPQPNLPPSSSFPQTTIGWREWVSLPGCGIRLIKAKIDTGARSSSLHALDIETFDHDGTEHVRFQVQPIQHRKDYVVTCQSPIHDVRNVRSSSGEAAMRYVIRTPVAWNGAVWEVDLTLADRSLMGFRMLIGREAVRGRMLVDPGRSFLGPRPSRIKKEQK